MFHFFDSARIVVIAIYRPHGQAVAQSVGCATALTLTLRASDESRWHTKATDGMLIERDKWW